MELIIRVILGVVGAALVAGGIVTYRRSTTTKVRALGAASIAARVVMWAIIVVTTPVMWSTGS